MLTATFVFKHNNSDGDFKALDDEIMLRAQRTLATRAKKSGCLQMEL